MNILSIASLCGGLAFFLYGMHVLSAGLEKMAGSRLEKLLKRMTSNPFKGLLLGAVITVAIQSSSAMTVMLVGLVNSGIMEFGSTIGVIMGSNIGTTLTAWVLSLSGIESGNIFVNMLKPENFAPVFALVGIVLLNAKGNRKKDFGEILIGFAILMSGMEMMKNAVSPLADMPGFTDMLVNFNNPLLGVLVGAVFTGAIQSSAASVGILQALSMTGSVTYGMAIPIIMGQNIGTCITAFMSSIGVNKNAKRVAVVHVSFNVLGTLLCMLIFYAANAFFGFTFINDAINPLSIAVCHSIFNIATTLLLFPFTKQLEKLATIIVRDKNTVQKTSFLDERLLRSPSFALAECMNMTVNMTHLSRDNVITALGLIKKYNADVARQVLEREEKIDKYEDKLGTYLVKLSNKELSDSDNNNISMMLHSISDIERIGDYAVNILRSAEEVHDKEIIFSADAEEEINRIISAITEILNITVECFENKDIPLAMKVEPLEQVIDEIIAAVRTRHVHRLQKGECTIELGFVFTDLLTCCRRISDHCSNIAVCVIQLENSVFDTHKYLNKLKNAGDPAFEMAFDAYSEKYCLPEYEK